MCLTALMNYTDRQEHKLIEAKNLENLVTLVNTHDGFKYCLMSYFLGDRSSGKWKCKWMGQNEHDGNPYDPI